MRHEVSEYGCYNEIFLFFHFGEQEGKFGVEKVGETDLYVIED